ncbi:MAG: RNA-guided pseudouridylation complex pseudouridine synthase subunit Cbf5 [Candidatus Thermoplasmatota archaeon]|nr:RNA-guided pseudouridylation complex pseudouridine synthase subunit Cbf5 [Candidatus Thermoplasmatota archaeon]
MRYTIEKVNTVSEWGEFPSRRSIEDAILRSLVIIDKPEGPSSHQVSSWVKKMFEKKAGHSGTLDPNATGVLPMGLGKAVRLLDLLHSVPKEYVAAMKFHDHVDRKDVEEILKEYKGEIYQKPPLRSGVKRERRKRSIYDLEILDVEGRDYLLRVRCESGTYIRTLCKDLGKTLGVGGHMMELRRTEAGGFSEDESVTLQDLRDAYEFYGESEEKELKSILLPYERALDNFAKVKVKDTAAGSILNGADLAVPGVLEMDDFSAEDKVAVVSPKEEGLAIGEALYNAEDVMEKEEGLVVKTDRVFSPSGEYPERWK